MRYAQPESPIVPATLPSGGSCVVRVLHQDTNTLLSLSTDQAVETVLPGVWQFSLANVTTAIDGFAQLVVEFAHSGGVRDYAKIVVRGYVDDVTKTRKLVGALL